MHTRFDRLTESLSRLLYETTIKYCKKKLNNIEPLAPVCNLILSAHINSLRNCLITSSSADINALKQTEKLLRLIDKCIKDNSKQETLN